MPATAPTPEHPDVALLAYETELKALVIEWNALDDAWPRGKTARGRRWYAGTVRTVLQRTDRLERKAAA